MTKITASNFGILREYKNKFDTLIKETILIKRYNKKQTINKPDIILTLRIKIDIYLVIVFIHIAFIKSPVILLFKKILFCKLTCLTYIVA